MPIDGTITSRPSLSGTVTYSSVVASGLIAGPSSVAGTVSRSSTVISGSLVGASATGDGVADGLINVKSSPYNCTGDGVASDTVGLQLAFAAAEAADLPIYFPPGTYLKGTALRPFSGMRLIALGRGSEFEHSVVIKDTSSDIFTPTADVTDIHIEGIQFQGNGGTLATDWWTVGTGFVLSFSTIEKCGFEFFKRVYHGQWTGVTFKDFYSNNCATNVSNFNVTGADRKSVV